MTGVSNERRDRPGALFDEVTLVDFSHLVDVLDPNADAMADHQIGKRLSVDQHDALGDPSDEVVGAGGKVRGGDQYALARPMALQAAHEIAHFGEGDGLVGIEPLGLHIDDVETEFVLLDDAVNAPSPTRPSALPISTRPPP